MLKGWLEMYEGFYNLRKNPFKIVVDSEMFFPSSAHEEALNMLLLCASEKKGFCVLTGEVGSGKTMVVKRFLRESVRIEPLMILNSMLSPKQLLESVMIELGLHVKSGISKAGMIQLIYNALLEKYAQNQTVVLIVDEAQNLPKSSLEELRMLSNLETETDKLIQIFLIGQPELKEKLLRHSLRQLNQRIYLRFHIPPLTLEESIKYLEHRIRNCGANPFDVMTYEAMKMTAIAGKGLPRLMNAIADNALISGMAGGIKPVSVGPVQEAVKSMGFAINITDEVLWDV